MHYCIETSDGITHFIDITDKINLYTLSTTQWIIGIEKNKQIFINKNQITVIKEMKN